jgi:type II secretory pathway pseudopilin PulG
MRRLREHPAPAAGFTLVEVLVVGGVLAILMAALVPNLLRARVRSQASAAVAEAIGQATTCSAVITAGVNALNVPNPADGANVNCSGLAPAQVQLQSRPWNGTIVAADGVNCLTPNGNGVAIVTAAGAQRWVTVSVAANGDLTCALN